MDAPCNASIVRILFFIEEGGIGGAEKVVLKLIKELKAKGFYVVVACLREGPFPKEVANMEIPCHIINSSRSYDLSLPFKIASLAKRYKCELIHSHLLDSNFYCALASKIARVPHIATEHGDVHHSHTKKLLGLKLKIISSLSSKIVCVSEYTKNYLLKSTVKESKIKVIHNPISLPSRIESKVWDKPTWTWIHVASLLPVKNQKLLLEAFAKSLSNVKDQKLVMLGDGPLREELEECAKNLSISHLVTFKGYVDNVHDYLEKADGFILSSLSESMPVSLLEAISYGLLCICSDVGGASEVIEDRKSGFLINNITADSLSMKMLEVLKMSTEEKNKISSNAIRKSTEFSTDIIINKYMELYDELK